MKIIELKDFKTLGEHELILVTGAIREIKEGMTRKKEPMTFITIEDLTGYLSFIEFREAAKVEEIMQSGLLYSIKGKTAPYQGKIIFNAHEVTPIEDTDENRLKYDKNTRKHVTPEMSKFLVHVFNNEFTDPRWKRLCQVSLGAGAVPIGIDEEEYKSRYYKFKAAWASTKYHDSYTGGLFNHVCGLIRLILSLKAQYSIPVARVEQRSSMDWDYLLSLAIIHDLGKLDEYEYGRYSCKYKPGKAVNHVYDGIIIFDRYYNQVEPELRISFAEYERMKYSILCHHGAYGEVKIKDDIDKLFNCIDTVEAVNVGALELDIEV